jgi:hypothetical protein
MWNQGSGSVLAMELAEAAFARDLPDGQAPRVETRARAAGPVEQAVAARVCPGHHHRPMERFRSR